MRAVHDPVTTRIRELVRGVQEFVAQGHIIKTTSPFLSIHSIIAPSTPPESPQWREYDTIKRSRFFDAFDSKENSTSLGEIARLLEISIPPSTARTWLKKREILGDQARRRTRKTSSKLERKSKVLDLKIV
jgi:hypothetical protein